MVRCTSAMSVSSVASVGISEIAIVGVGDNHARKKGQDRLYCSTKVVRQTPKGQRAVRFLFRLTIRLAAADFGSYCSSLNLATLMIMIDNAAKASMGVMPRHFSSLARRTWQSLYCTENCNASTARSHCFHRWQKRSVVSNSPKSLMEPLVQKSSLHS